MGSGKGQSKRVKTMTTAPLIKSNEFVININNMGLKNGKTDLSITKKISTGLTLFVDNDSVYLDPNSHRSNNLPTANQARKDRTPSLSKDVFIDCLQDFVDTPNVERAFSLNGQDGEISVEIMEITAKDEFKTICFHVVKNERRKDLAFTFSKEKAEEFISIIKDIDKQKQFENTKNDSLKKLNTFDINF